MFPVHGAEPCTRKRIKNTDPQGCSCTWGTANAQYVMGEYGKLRIYLDDERDTPEGWIRVYCPDEAIELLKTGEVAEISLDHDLGNDERGTGYDVILWIEEAVITEGFRPPRIKVHSANASAREKMELGIQTIKKYAKEK